MDLKILISSTEKNHREPNIVTPYIIYKYIINNIILLQLNKSSAKF